MKVLFCLVLFSSTPPQQDDPLSSKIQKLMQRADRCYRQRATRGMPEKAISTYQKVLVLREKTLEAYWKIARTYYWTGAHTNDRKKQARMYRDAVDYCKMAVALDPDNVPSHFWLGVMYGLYGQTKGILQSLSLIGPMKKEMSFVLERQEDYEYGGAHRVLGWMYYKLPGIQGGDNEKAIKHLRRSLELGPGMHKGYLFLAVVLYDEGKKEEAIQLLRKAAKMKKHPVWTPESIESRDAIRKLLRKWDTK